MTTVTTNDRPTKIWLWKNGEHEFLAFGNPYPCYQNGDPMTLGEPCGYAWLNDSKNGRPDVSEDKVMEAMKNAKR